MYTIYKYHFLFTRTDDNWKWKHLVPNGNPSCMTFHLLYYGQYPNLFDLGLEWNVIQSLVVGIDSTQMHWFGEHEASSIHSEFEHFYFGALQNSICTSSSPL